MDNTSFHKRIDIKDAIKQAGHILFYQPQYSPELNPIEKKWAQAKHFIRKFQCSVEMIFQRHLPKHFILN